MPASLLRKVSSKPLALARGLFFLEKYSCFIALVSFFMYNYLMEKINILGVNITDITKAQVLNKIREFLTGRKQYSIVTPNPEIILGATTEDEEAYYILNHADISLADGIALKFAGWFYGKNIERITGADLTLEILKLAQAEKKKVAIFNWSRGLSTAAEIKQALADKFPGLDVFVQDIERETVVDFTAVQLRDNSSVSSKEQIKSPPPPLLKGVNDFAPDIIFCALGFPYQEKFIYYNLAKIPSARLGLSVGGSFDYLTGKAVRAPKWLRGLGLEWFWRLMKQPKRWRRIYRATVVFIFRFFKFFFILRWFYRPNVSCLLFKRENGNYKILIVERVGEREHWQLPQGGTDGESLLIAGARELKEELNTMNFKPVAVYKNLFQYKFSRYLDRYGRPIKNQRGYKGQKQGLFIGEFLGDDSEIKVNFWEHAGWRWTPAEKLVESVHPNRQEATTIFLKKFWETVN